MTSQSSFKALEERLDEMKRQRDAGEISPEEFRQQLQALCLTVGGEEWRLGVAGQWVKRIGGEWTPATPPACEAEEPLTEPPDGFRYDVFISHSHTDRAWVHEWLLPRLEAAGLRVCIGDRDFDIGTATLKNIESAVDSSRHTLLVLTPAWLRSEWADFEGLLAASSDPAGRKRKLIPLMLKLCKLPPRIAMLTYANFTRTSEREAQMTKLVKSVSQAAAPPISPTSSKKYRRIDAATPSCAEVGQQIDVLVQVRFPNSPKLGREDWPTKQKPHSIEQVSDKLALRFPIDIRTGKPGPVRLQVRVVAPDFKIEGASQKFVEVPPNQESKLISFLLTATKTGSCRINVEVYSVDDVWLGTIPLESIIGEAAAISSTLLVANLFLVVIVEGDLDPSQTSNKADARLNRDVRQQRLTELMARADWAIAAEDWDPAIEALEDVVQIDAAYGDVGKKLSHAKAQRQLVDKYQQAQIALKEGLQSYDRRKLEIAVELFGQIKQQEPDYKKAASQLQMAQEALQLLDDYTLAQRLFNAEKWSEAEEKFVQVAARDAAYRDTQAYLNNTKINQVAERHWHQAESLIKRSEPSGEELRKARAQLEQILSSGHSAYEKKASAQFKEVNSRLEQLIAQKRQQLHTSIKVPNWDQAEGALNALREIDPDSYHTGKQQLHNALQHAAQKAQDAKKWEQAKQLWGRLERLNT